VVGACDVEWIESAVGRRIPLDYSASGGSWAFLKAVIPGQDHAVTCVRRVHAALCAMHASHFGTTGLIDMPISHLHL
jgi:hypothetical protein